MYSKYERCRSQTSDLTHMQTGLVKPVPGTNVLNKPTRLQCGVVCWMSVLCDDWILKIKCKSCFFLLNHIESCNDCTGLICVGLYGWHVLCFDGIVVRSSNEPLMNLFKYLEECFFLKHCSLCHVGCCVRPSPICWVTFTFEMAREPMSWLNTSHNVSEPSDSIVKMVEHSAILLFCWICSWLVETQSLTHADSIRCSYTLFSVCLSVLSVNILHTSWMCAEFPSVFQHL